MSARNVAEQAVDAWRAGAASGDWGAMTALLGEDVRITMPFKERWRGEKRGIAAARELLRHAADDLRVRLEQRAVGSLLGDGPCFAIELIGEGTIEGKAATVPVSLWFEVRDERIAAVREYLGDPA